jgi:hypothetical protein
VNIYKQSDPLSAMYNLYRVSADFAVCNRLKQSHTRLPAERNMHENVHANTNSQHARNDTKALEVLWLLGRREQVRAVNLGQVTERIDKRKCNGADFRLHGSEGGTGKGERDGVGGPESGGHEHEQSVARFELVDDAHEDRGDEREAEPARNDETAVVGDGVGVVGGDCGADECDGVDGDGHVLCLDSGCVAESVDEGGVEV